MVAELIGQMEGILVNCAVHFLANFLFDLPVEKDQIRLFELGVGGIQKVFSVDVESVFIKELM